MFERFTLAGRHIMIFANEEARQLGHSSITSDHLLLGILRLPEYVADSDSQRAADSLGALNITLPMIRERVGPRHVRTGRPVQIALSDDAKAALEQTLRGAMARKREAIEATDFLLGLVAKPELGSAQVLEELGVSAQALRDQVEKRL